jgi:hypothetical protein
LVELREAVKMTLDQFLKDNREELISRTRAKVVSRSPSPPDATELEQGVPLFLSQLSATLADQGLGETDDPTRASHKSHPAIGESAIRHGKDLRRLGFSIEQVVHNYGDICQAVTELAEERGATLSIAEFHTLNRCLDNAIAGAVSSWSAERDLAHADSATRTSETLVRDLGELLERAQTTLAVVREGRVAVGGATGTLLHRALIEMRAMLDRATA